MLACVCPVAAAAHYWGWTDRQMLWHAIRMPAPITKLSDRFADYTLRIKCRKCGHERVTEPHAIAKLLGWETPLEKVAIRLRCSKCNTRGECELSAVSQASSCSRRPLLYMRGGPARVRYSSGGIVEAATSCS
jgi:ribosomal protein L44E